MARRHLTTLAVAIAMVVIGISTVLNAEPPQSYLGILLLLLGIGLFIYR